MWEVFTEGRMPFEKNTNYEVVTMVTRGHRLYRPKLASIYVYEVMLRCWQEVLMLLFFFFYPNLQNMHRSNLVDGLGMVFIAQ
jgi:hypothetical protein